MQEFFFVLILSTTLWHQNDVISLHDQWNHLLIHHPDRLFLRCLSPNQTPRHLTSSSLHWVQKEIYFICLQGKPQLKFNTVCDGNFVLHEEQCELKSYTGMFNVTIERNL